ncbi:MAG: VOC family protein [Rhizobiaceae bacterium]|nr:VOC family protein [Rhizobiaceae bacterium]
MAYDAHKVVWAEVPVTDLEKARVFYETVLGWPTELHTDGPNPLVAIGSMAEPVVSGHLYPGTPAPRGTGNTVHFMVKGTLEDAMARVGPAGGEVVSPIVTIPAGRFAYMVDPDGNSIGLFVTS